MGRYRWPVPHARTVAEKDGRHVGRPLEKIEYARLLKAQTGIPKTSLHRYLTGPASAAATEPAEGSRADFVGPLDGGVDHVGTGRHGNVPAGVEIQRDR
jgi:hypothetical protein